MSWGPAEDEEPASGRRMESARVGGQPAGQQHLCLVRLLVGASMLLLASAPGRPCETRAPPSAPDTARAAQRGLLAGLAARLSASGAQPDHGDRWLSSMGLFAGAARPPAKPDREPPGRPGTNQLVRALNRIGQRIGARNSIRVHNAFRDLAWRLLASLSMPTPIIYELRRQHLYSAEEDEANDQLYNRNTSSTIRSKRQLGPQTKLDPEEPEELRDRIRLRLEDLISLSSRRLFGRVIRLPALFPFKRQQETDEAQPPQQMELSQKPESTRLEGSTQLNQTQARARRRQLPRLFGALRWRREPDRQLILIDGKQYYVNDEGELKELQSSPDSDSLS